MALARGLELAIYQPVVDWAVLTQATGINFVVVKASEARTQDPLFQQHWAGAKAAGLLRGAYHFLRQATDPQAQVDAFLNALGGDPGELPPTLDIEDTRMTSPSAMAAAAQFWLRAVESALHRKPMIYTAAWWWNPGLFFGGRYPDWAPSYDLWVASWPMKKSVPTIAQIEQAQFKPIMPKSWTSWRFWQYSGDAATVPGITNTNGSPVTVDLDVFNGTPDDLRALAQSLGPVGQAATVTLPPAPVMSPPGPVPPTPAPAVVAVLRLPDPRVTNQIMINAFSHAFGSGYWDVVLRAGLGSLADQRQAEYPGPGIAALSGLTDVEQAMLQQQLTQIVSG
jgi:lysozyme